MSGKKALLACGILFAILQPSAFTAPRQAPGFALNNNRGTMVYRSSYKGNLILSFFASHCRPCKKELPVIIDLVRKYAGEKNLQLVLIATDADDSSGSAREKAGSFLKGIGVERDFLLDIYQVVIEKYNPRKSVPALFLVNRAGFIMFEELGARDDTVVRLENAIRSLR